MLKTGLQMTRGLLIGELTFKQVLMQVRMRFFNSQSNLKDDFDWNSYHLHYKEELKVMDRFFLTLPQPSDYAFREGRLVKLNPAVKDLHSNHHLLYEVVLGLQPKSVIEVGCGGGDHLRNLNLFAPEIELFGLDRSEGQIATLRQRHPQLSANLKVVDATLPNGEVNLADVAYTQAVLMHISERDNRYANALRNVFRAAKSHVVLMENWTQHQFLDDVNRLIGDDSLGWSDANVYFTYRDAAPATCLMIISKQSLPYARLERYDSLLQGQSLNLNRRD